MDDTADTLLDLLGADSYGMYHRLNDFLLDRYNVAPVWDKGGKYGKACLRYSRSGKTLCTLYFRERQLGIWIILGKEERDWFDAARDRFSPAVKAQYDATPVYHDGKWLAFDTEDDRFFDDITFLLSVKKKPDRKLTMCGYCCDMCKAYAPNIRKKDERVQMADYWHRYYGLDIPAEAIGCDGCRCMKKDAHRIDSACPVRACVLDKKLNDCSQCPQYPCDIFLSRKGLTYEEACGIEKISAADYHAFLGAFDNKSRLDRKIKP